MNTKGKVILAFITIFILGIASGYTLHSLIQKTDRGFTSTRFDDGNGDLHTQRGDRQRNRERAQDRLASHLELTEEQKEVFFDKMSDYLQGVRTKTAEFREEESRDLQNYYNDFRANISDILTANQLEKLDEIIHPDSVHRMRRHNRTRFDRNRN